MLKPENLLLFVLIVAVLALGLATYSLSLISQYNAKIAEVSSLSERMKPIVQNFEPLLPKLSKLMSQIDQIEYLLLGTAPAPSK